MNEFSLNNLNSFFTTCPFFYYKKPNCTFVHFGLQLYETKCTGKLDNVLDKQGFIIHPFEKTDIYPAYIIQDDISLVWENYNKGIYPIFENDFIFKDEISKSLLYTTYETYLKQCSSMIDKIKEHQISKAILSRIIHSDLSNVKKAPGLFKNLCELYPNAFVFWVHIPNKISWIGATPERLLSFRDNRISTMALAGTQVWEEGITENPNNWKEKELLEQQYVSDYINEIIHNNPVLNIKRSPLHVKKAGNMGHLETIFEGNMNLKDAPELVNQLHPTPAVCGTPLKDSLKLIKEIEPHDRTYYAGFVGYNNPRNKEFDFYVNLRCASLHDKEINLYVGGGITTDSKPEQEWNETCLKAQTILKAIK